MSPPQQLRQQTFNCSSLLIYRPRKDERLSWPSCSSSTSFIITGILYRNFLTQLIEILLFCSVKNWLFCSVQCLLRATFCNCNYITLHKEYFVKYAIANHIPWKQISQPIDWCKFHSDRSTFEKVIAKIQRGPNFMKHGVHAKNWCYFVRLPRGKPGTHYS